MLCGSLGTLSTRASTYEHVSHATAVATSPLITPTALLPRSFVAESHPALLKRLHNSSHTRIHAQAPLQTLVKRDEFLFLTEKSSLPLPIPPVLHNDGNYIISLGQLCRWLATQAEELGVEIYPGFSASEV